MSSAHRPCDQRPQSISEASALGNVSLRIVKTTPPFYTSIVDFGQFSLEFFIMYKIGDDMDILLLDGSAGQIGSMSGMSTNMF